MKKMPKIILTYSQDQSEEAMDAINAQKYKDAIEEMDQWLRSIIKYDQPILNDADLLPNECSDNRLLRACKEIGLLNTIEGMVAQKVRDKLSELKSEV